MADHFSIGRNDPLGIAMTNAEADAWITKELLQFMDGQKPLINIGILFLTTMLLSGGVVSNNATAIIMAPIGISLAKGLALDPKPLFWQ